MKYVVTHQRRVSHIVSTVRPRAFNGYDEARQAAGYVYTMCGSWYSLEGVSGIAVLRICPRCEAVADRRRRKVAELSADL